jgi:hypothetical protein
MDRSYATLDARLLLGAADLEAASTVEAYAQSMVRTRLALGTASLSERLRGWFGLGPPEWMHETARHHFEFQHTLASLREQYPQSQ